jgi:autotransporter-associated beta strand protein
LGTLVLSADNAYSGGTTLKAGTLDLGAAGAAGIGGIAFAGHATLRIENAAVSGNVFGNQIEFFGKHDVLDLRGLHFHAAGAAAIYDSTTQHLVVHSGSVNDTLTLLSPKGLSFSVANDGHGGTKVTLAPSAHTATIASLSSHDLGGQHAATDLAGSANHLGDFLFVA